MTINVYVTKKCSVSYSKYFSFIFYDFQHFVIIYSVVMSISVLKTTNGFIINITHITEMQPGAVTNCYKSLFTVSCKN